jgi:hypothetical protein
LIPNQNQVWDIQRGHEPPPNTGYGFVRYAGSTLINHLKICERQTPEVRAVAKHESVSPRKPSASSSHLRNTQSPWPPSNPSAPHYSPSYPQMLPPSAPSTRACSPTASTSSLPPLPSPYTNLLVPMEQSPLLSPGHPLTNHPTPRSRSQSILIDDSTVWPPGFQVLFEQRIARLTVSAGLPLSWVDNPEWIDFVHDFLPAARSPSRKVLTNRLIPGAANDYRDATKIAARNQNATLQADGWTGMNFHHLLW